MQSNQHVAQSPRPATAKTLNGSTTTVHQLATEPYRTLELINLVNSNPEILSQKDSHGRVALHNAAQHGNMLAFDFLMTKDNGAHAYTPDDKGETPASLLFRHVVHKVSHQFEVNEKQNKDVTTSHAAVEYNRHCNKVQYKHYILLRLISFFMPSEPNESQHDATFANIAAFLSFLTIANIPVPPIPRASFSRPVSARIIKELLQYPSIQNGNIPLAINTNNSDRDDVKDQGIVIFGFQLDQRSMATTRKTILCHVDSKETILYPKSSRATHAYIKQHLPISEENECCVNEKLCLSDLRNSLLTTYRDYLLRGNNIAAQDFLEEILVEAYKTADKETRFQRAEEFLSSFSLAPAHLYSLMAFIRRIELKIDAQDAPLLTTAAANLFKAHQSLPPSLPPTEDSPTIDFELPPSLR